MEPGFPDALTLLERLTVALGAAAVWLALGGNSG